MVIRVNVGRVGGGMGEEEWRRAVGTRGSR